MTGLAIASGRHSGERVQRPACAVPVSAGVLRRVWALPLLLVGLALALTLPRLDVPSTYVFDELYYAYTAGRYVGGAGDAYQCCVPPRDEPAIEWTHPPLAKLLIAGGIIAFGDSPLGWRAVSVLFGAVGVAVVFFLARALTGNAMTAALAAGLLLLNGLYVVEARTGMSNLILLVSTNAALLAFAWVLAAPVRMSLSLPLLLTGAMLGLALSTKWSAVAVVGLVGLVYGWRGIRALCGSPAALRAYLRWGIVSLIVVPVAIYLASYLHFFLTGHDWAEFIALHRAMVDYHRNLGVVHPYSSSWWEWPLAARPIWYYAESSAASGRFVFANVNPVLVWPMVVAVGWVSIDWWKRRPEALAVLAIGFFGQWLPWALSPRGTFVYHFLPALPLGCVALAVVMGDAWAEGGWRRPVVLAYGLAAVAVFAYFYPLTTAMPVSPDDVNARMWLASWR
jgi:dolichyl-phosphate-mannose--protein O-mannosyl transferase